MSKIKLPDMYTEISYEYGESYGSGTDQQEVLEWVGAGVGCAAVAGSIFVGIHRAVQGYWIWNRTAANMEPSHRKVYLNKMQPVEQEFFRGLTPTQRGVYMGCRKKFGPPGSYKEDFEGWQKKNDLYNL